MLERGRVTHYVPASSGGCIPEPKFMFWLMFKKPEVKIYSLEVFPLKRVSF